MNGKKYTAAFCGFFCLFFSNKTIFMHKTVLSFLEQFGKVHLPVNVYIYCTFILHLAKYIYLLISVRTVTYNFGYI